MCTFNFDWPQKVSNNRKHWRLIITQYHLLSREPVVCVWGLTHNKLLIVLICYAKAYSVKDNSFQLAWAYLLKYVFICIQSDITSLQTFVLHLQQKQGLSQAAPEKFHPKESKYLPPFSHNTFKYSRLLITRTSKGNRKKFDLSGPRRK